MMALFNKKTPIWVIDHREALDLWKSTFSQLMSQRLSVESCCTGADLACQRFERASIVIQERTEKILKEKSKDGK